MRVYRVVCYVRAADDAQLDEALKQIPGLIDGTVDAEAVSEEDDAK